MTRVEKLLSISSQPLVRTPPLNWDLVKDYPLGPDLLHMLERKNGFYAFESALHVFPLTHEPAEGLSLVQWNCASAWRANYGDLTTGLLFFAEDVFQDQFCLSTGGVLRFTAETGGTKPMANSLEDWADIILRDYECEVLI